MTWYRSISSNLPVSDKRFSKALLGNFENAWSVGANMVNGPSNFKTLNRSAVSRD